MKYLLSYIFTLTVGFSIAQSSTPLIDSLLKIVEVGSSSAGEIKLANVSDTNIVKTLNLLSFQYIRIGNSKNAKFYAQEAILKSSEIEYQKGTALAYCNLGSAYSFSCNYDVALSNYIEALKINEMINDEQGIANCYNVIGNIFSSLNNIEKALENYNRALKIYVDITNNIGMANVYINIGNVYLYKKNYDKTLENYFKVVELREQLRDKQGAAAAYNNIGIVYMFMGNYNKSLEYHFKVLETRKESGIKFDIAGSYDNIGNVFLKQGKMKEAYSYLTQALHIYQETGKADAVKDIYYSMAELFNNKGDYKRAYEYHRLYSLIKDSLFNEQSSKQIAEMNVVYESGKREKDIQLLTRDKKIQQSEIGKQKFIRNGILIGFVISLAFVLLLLNRFKITKKQKQIIELKNIETEKQKKIIEKKNQETISSIDYARVIQKAMLPHRKDIWDAFPNSFIMLKPKDIVSGDFYFFSPVIYTENSMLLAPGHTRVEVILLLLQIVPDMEFLVR